MKSKKSFFMFFLSLLIICPFIIYYYFIFLPPRVIDLVPPDESGGVSLNASLMIKFDKPVKRQNLKFSITPETPGRWEGRDPLLKNHFFRTLIFIPAVSLESNIRYAVRLENIKSFGPGKTNSFSFSFKTEQNEKLKITKLDIPLDLQDYSLSCEAASLKMAMAGKGIRVSEEEIMEKISYDPTPHKDNIWGDPYLAFVGKIDGKICSTGYGVYWEPVAKAANHWTEAQSFSNWRIEDLIKEIKSGNPVIVWGALSNSLTDCSWFTPEGKYIKAYKETHVKLLIGFVGSPENPSKIILNDPLKGELYWEVPYFKDNWAIFGNSGVVVK